MLADRHFVWTYWSHNDCSAVEQSYTKVKRSHGTDLPRREQLVRACHEWASGTRRCIRNGWLAYETRINAWNSSVCQKIAMQNAMLKHAKNTLKIWNTARIKSDLLLSRNKSTERVTETDSKYPPFVHLNAFNFQRCKLNCNFYATLRSGKLVYVSNDNFITNMNFILLRSNLPCAS